MDKERLKKILLGGRTNLFAVLDGVSVPNLPQRLYTSGLPNLCLIAGELTPDVVYAAPYVVQLTDGNDFSDWILAESFGKHWGIFAHTLTSMTEMRRHFRSLLTVYSESGQAMTFRFYDPRVLRKFLPTCNSGEAKTLFGKIDALYAENAAAGTITRFTVEEDQLKMTEVS